MKLSVEFHAAYVPIAPRRRWIWELVLGDILYRIKKGEKDGWDADLCDGAYLYADIDWRALLALASDDRSFADID